MPGDRRGRLPPVLAVLGMLAIAAPITLMGWRGGEQVRRAQTASAKPGKRPGAVRTGPVPTLGTHQKGPGDLALPGIVVDASGAPVRGATITAELELGPGDRSLAPGATDDPDAAAPAVVVATTGPDGRFTLEGLVAGRHRLEVEGSDIFTAEVRFVPVPSDDARIVVARRISIAGRVVAGGGPGGGATVEVAGDAIAGRRTLIADPDGGFSFDALPEGTYQVWAWKEAQVARAQRVPRIGAGPFAPVLLVFEEGAIVVGRVVDRDGGGGVAAAVELRALDSPDEAARYARTGDDGAFRVEGIPGGRWTADAWSPGWVTVGTVEFEAGRGAPQVELARGGVIEGSVVDDQGRPVANASVRAVAPATATAPGLVLSAREAEDRLRRYSGLAPATLPEAGGAVPAAADPQFVVRGELGVMLGPIPYPPPPGATGRVVRPAAIIDPTLAPDAFGLDDDVMRDPAAFDPYAPLPEDPARAAVWTTDADGRFRITGLPAGTTTVRASAPGFAEGASGAIASAPGTVTTGVVIALSIGAVVAGTVTDQHGAPVIGATVAVVPRGNAVEPGLRLETVTDTAGAYRLGPTTGEVTVSAAAYGHGDASADVALPRPAPGSTEPPVERVDLVLVVADAVLVGTVEDPGGLPVRAATVSIVDGPGAGRSAVTTEAGFSIPMLPPGKVTVRIDHPDYPLREAAATTDAIAHLTLPWGGGVSGLVLDHHTGAAVGAVVVAGRGPAGVTSETAVGPDGTFDLVPLVPGAWRLSVTLPGYLPVVQDVTVTAGDRAGAITVRDVRIELERGATLAGTVRDRFGSRVPGVAIAVQRASGDGPTATARTDADGQFRIRDAPTGALRLRGEKDALVGELELTTAPGDERLSLELEVR